MYTYLKLTIRQLLSNKLITGIKITGLTLGFTLSVLLIWYARFEFSYDNFHKNAPDIYRLQTEYSMGKGINYFCAPSDPAWGPVLKADFSEVKDFVRIYVMGGNRVVKYNNIKFRENRIYTVDPSFFRIFDYPLIKGDAGTVLKRPNTMVISESMALKYFGNEDPVGKTMEISNGNKFALHEITGVFKDFPVNSNLKYDFMVSWETIRSGWPEVETSWNLEFCYTYLLLDNKVSPHNIEQQSHDLFHKYSGSKNVDKSVKLIPLRDIHLEPARQWEKETKGNRTVTWIIMVLGFAILLIALINHVNIIISQSMERAKSIGLLHSFGSGKMSIVRYFMQESVTINLVSLVLSVVVIFLSSSLLMDISVSFSPHLIFSSQLFWIIAGTELISSIAISGLLSGIAFSRINSLSLLKGTYKTSTSGVLVRKGFTVFQFVISIGFIIATVMVYRQMNFVSKKDLGVDMQHMLALRTPVGEDFDFTKIHGFKSEIIKNPEITEVAMSSDIPGQHGSSGTFVRRNPTDQEDPIFNIIICDQNYIQSYGLKIIAGKYFSDVPQNNKTSVLLNEKAVAILNYKPDETVGRFIYLPELNNAPYKVIGVLKNFNQLSLHEDFIPIMIMGEGLPWLSYSFFSLKIKTANYAQIIAKVEKEWQRFFPSSTLDYFFVDQFFNEQYNQDWLFSRVLILFSVLSVLISCLGVFALSLYLTAQRTKEIGIRKINGARISEVMTMLNRDFVKWVTIAFVIASPIAYYAMRKWLQNFAYKTELSWWIFALAGLMALGVALLTVSWQSWKAATRNPVEALRYE